MTHSRKALAACCLVVLMGVLAGPVAGASASKASIKAAIKSYSGKLAVAEGHTLTAFGEYKTTHNAAPVAEAITKSVAVLTALRTKISAQSAVAHSVKVAKSKLVKGLEAVIVAYEKLSAAFSLKTSSPQVAQAEGEKALVAIKSGRKQLGEASKLLLA